MTSSQHVKRTLMLASRLPFPLDDGWKVRAYHILRGVASASPVTFVTYASYDPVHAPDALRESVSMPGLEVIAIPPPPFYSVGRVLRGAVSSYPIAYWNANSRELRSCLATVCTARPHHLSFAVGAFMAPLLYRLPFAHRVVDTHNIDSLLYSRYATSMKPSLRRCYSGLTSIKAAHLEREVFAVSDDVWVCSPEEAKWLQRHGVAGQFSVIPNGVDAATFAQVADKPEDPRRLLFFGKLNYLPNVDAVKWLASEIVPAFRRLALPVSVSVLGLDASDAVRKACQAIPELQLLPPVPRIEDALAQHGIVIVPLRMGGGTRLKILEALAAGRPVITTRLGGEGLPLENAKHVLFAETADEFAMALQRLQESPELARRIASAGRRLAADSFDWARIEEAAADRIRQLLAPALGDTFPGNRQ